VKNNEERELQRCASTTNGTGRLSLPAQKINFRHHTENDSAQKTSLFRINPAHNSPGNLRPHHTQQ